MKSKLFLMVAFSSLMGIQMVVAQDEGLGTPGYDTITYPCDGGGEVYRCEWNDLSSCIVSGQDFCD
jgi:hypothetical protein